MCYEFQNLLAITAAFGLIRNYFQTHSKALEKGEQKNSQTILKASSKIFSRALNKLIQMNQSVFAVYRRV